MYRSIVVGTDGSPTAAGAVSAAIALAKALGAELHVVCAVRDAVPTTAMAAAAGVPTDITGLVEAARDHMDAVLGEARARAEAEQVPTTVHPCTGSAGEMLVRVAASEGADLIVVGNRGMHGARRILGSVPSHVAHHAPCAVMIVPTS